MRGKKRRPRKKAPVAKKNPVSAGHLGRTPKMGGRNRA